MNFVKSSTGIIHIASESNNDKPLCNSVQNETFSPVKLNNYRIDCKECLAKTQPTAVLDMDSGMTLAPTMK